MFIAAAAWRPRTFMSRLDRLLLTTAQKRSRARVDRAIHAAARASCTLTSLHLLLQFRRRCMTIALWGVLLCNERDVNCASNHIHQYKTNHIYNLIPHQRVDRNILLLLGKVATSKAYGADKGE